MSVRALHLLALVLGGVTLVIVAVFGAIVVLAYRDRRPGFGYFACGITTPKVDQDF
jgi:hypothetical protein